MRVFRVDWPSNVSVGGGWRLRAALGTIPIYGRRLGAAALAEMVLPPVADAVPALRSPRPVRAAAALEESRLLAEHEDRPHDRGGRLQCSARRDGGHGDPCD